MKIVIGNANHRGLGGFAAQTVVLTLAVMIAAHIMNGVHIDSLWTLLLTGLVIALLNRFVKPVLVFLTLPFTALTLGMFLFVINAVMILLASAIVPKFTVDGFGTALLFSLLLTTISFFLELPNRIVKQGENGAMGQATRQSANQSEEGFDPYEEVE